MTETTAPKKAAKTKDDEVDLAPGPEAPEVVVDAEDTSTTVLGTVVRDSEVEADNDLPSSVAPVESLGGAVAPHGFVLVINGEGYAFSPSMTASLRQIVNSAIAGIAL